MKCLIDHPATATTLKSRVIKLGSRGIVPKVICLDVVRTKLGPENYEIRESNRTRLRINIYYADFIKVAAELVFENQKIHFHSKIGI